MMSKMKGRVSPRDYWLGLLLVLAVLSVTFLGLLAGGGSIEPAAFPVLNPMSLLGSWESERSDGRYCVLVDESGQVLDETGLPVFADDVLITEQNLRYLVQKVDGDVAHCRYMGIENMEPAAATDAVNVMATAAAAESGKAMVGIYHTHGGESYEPSQGTDSVRGKGGISEVAAALSEKLQSMGVATIYQDTPHTPNDAGAYRRSRRTATSLMKQGAKVLIDVHRDAAPASVYATKINNQEATKIKLVVGRQNPQQSSVLGMAKKIKAETDKTYPGLIKSIYMGKGNYNQDLSPTTMLVEMGSEKVTLESAKQSAVFLGEIIPKIIGTSGPVSGTTKVKNEAGDGGSMKAIGWILAIVILGGGGFLLLSTGSFRGAWGKLRQFGGSEWSNFLGRMSKKDDGE